MNENMTYHEIDFILPAQKFNIQFSYVTKKGLPFIREFVLRLIHVAPVTKCQISTFFGMSQRETDEAVNDLIMRGDLTLTPHGRLTLTDKSSEYFTEMGELPKLSTVQDSGASLSFDLVTFSCFGGVKIKDNWKSGLLLNVDGEKSSCSEKHVEKHFQIQFNQILEKEYLSKSITKEDIDKPSIYTVNSVNKLRQIPLRLKTHFQIDNTGNAVERDDYDELNNSEEVHELIAKELSRLSKSNNAASIFKAMVEIGDEDTVKLIDSLTNSVNPRYLEEINRIERNSNSGRSTLIGPIYSKDNWDKLQVLLAPILTRYLKGKEEPGIRRYIWLAPSDSFWGKSDRFASSVSDFIHRSRTKEHALYEPVIYLPLMDDEDRRGANQWLNEIDSQRKYLKGIMEGLLDGNVEVLHLEDELVVVLYHFSQPESFPVTMPFGFVSNNQATVKRIGVIVNEYINDVSSYDKQHDFGYLSKIASRNQS